MRYHSDRNASTYISSIEIASILFLVCVGFEFEPGYLQDVIEEWKKQDAADVVEKVQRVADVSQVRYSDIKKVSIIRTISYHIERKISHPQQMAIKIMCVQYFIYPNLPLWYVAQDLYSIDPTQETCPRSCRFIRLPRGNTEPDHTDQEYICPDRCI